mmetsp:Transcript_18545/g.40127  ORF Transcript_18545/g.40127 Transcript_18545/m.40127 type:complete len:232 (+) Transcript_18545:106-801(+)
MTHPKKIKVSPFLLSTRQRNPNNHHHLSSIHAPLSLSLSLQKRTHLLRITRSGSLSLNLLNHNLRLLRIQNLVHTIPLIIQTHSKQLQLIRRCHRSIHSLIQNLDRKTQCLRHIRHFNLLRCIIIIRLHLIISLTLLSIIRLEQTLASLIIRSNHRSLPPTIIPTRITLIQLKPMLFIIPRKQERYPERPQSSVLSVGLFVVTDVFDEVFDGDGFLVLVGVAAGAEAGLVD